MNKKEQRLGMVAMILLILFIAGGSLCAFFITRKEATTEQEKMPKGKKEQFSGVEGIISASGTTAIGMDAVTFDIDFLEETSLYVEEVYFSNGDEVEAGTKLFKLTEESVEDARGELQNAAKDAELSYRSSVITTHQSKIQAKYTYEAALLEAQQAEQVYTDTLEQLQTSVDKAKSVYDEAREAYDELYDAVSNNTLREEYEVDEKKAAYDEAHELYVTKVAYWEVTAEEMKSSSSDSGTAAMAQGAASVPGTGGMQMGIDREAAASAADRKWILKTVQLLKEEEEENKQEYEQAQSDYEDALESAELDLKMLLNKLETAREDYEEAELECQKNSTSAKTAYELSLAKQETAQTDYDTTITSLDEALEKLQDTKEKADKNLSLFEKLIGDGYFYTTEAGTILMIRVTKGQALAGDDILFAYSNPAEISVSVSVAQDDIAELAVGDTATIMISNVGNYTGTIITINPIASSDSRTSVSYTVQLAIEGDVSVIEANLSATVIFGEMEIPQDMDNSSEKTKGMEIPSDMKNEPQMQKGEANE